MFKKIIVPLDGSPPAKRALVPAKALADQAGVPVELVMSGVSGRTTWPREYLRHAARQTDLVNFHIRTSTEGIEELLADVTDERESLVCMTTHGRNHIQESFLGRHTAKDLIDRIDSPFLVVGPRANVAPGWRADEVFVCTDGSANARAIIPFASDMAEACAVAMHVVSVVPQETVERVRAAGRDVLEEVAARSIAEELSDGAPVDWEILHGHHPASTIVEYADATPNSVIAMASHGRSGLARTAVGSVTDAVIRFAASPVLVVRAPGRCEEEVSR